MKLKNSSSYRKCSIFIPFLSHEIDTVSIKVGVWGHAKSAQLQEQQQQNCSCLHHVSKNLYKQKFSVSQLNNRSENKEGSSVTVHPTGRTRSASIYVHFGQQLHFFEVCHQSMRKFTARTFLELMLLFRCIFFSADMLHVQYICSLSSNLGLYTQMLMLMHENLLLISNMTQ